MIELASLGMSSFTITFPASSRSGLPQLGHVYHRFFHLLRSPLICDFTQAGQSLTALENLVERGLEFFRRPFYVVLDGLEECDNVACTRIINFFNRLFKRHQDQTGSDSSLWVKLVSAKAQDPTR